MGPESSRRLSGRPYVHPYTISNINISATSRLIDIQFYLNHHWGVGKADVDRIRTLGFMATDSSHKVIMRKTVLPIFLGCFSSDPFYTCR